MLIALVSALKINSTKESSGWKILKITSCMTILIKVVAIITQGPLQNRCFKHPLSHVMKSFLHTCFWRTRSIYILRKLGENLSLSRWPIKIMQLIQCFYKQTILSAKFPGQNDRLNKHAQDKEDFSTQSVYKKTILKPDLCTRRSQILNEQGICSAR